MSEVVLVSNGSSLDTAFEQNDKRALFQGKLSENTWIYICSDYTVPRSLLPRIKNLRGLGITEIDLNNSTISDYIYKAYNTSWQFFINGWQPGLPFIAHVDDWSYNAVSNSADANYNYSARQKSKAQQSFYDNLEDIKSSQADFNNKRISFAACTEKINAAFSSMNSIYSELNIEEAFNLYLTVFSPEESSYQNISQYVLQRKDLYEGMVLQFNNMHNLLQQSENYLKSQLRTIVESSDNPHTKSAGKTAGQKLAEYMAANFQENINLALVSEAVGFSKSYASAQIKAYTGMGFTDYLTKLRLNEAAALLKETSLSINEISYRVGYKDPAYFRKVFQKNFHKIPSELRNPEL